MAHPIESIMGTTMENLREMADVNTVVGDAVQTPDGSTIIPISKVSFGFVAGGGEYETAGAAKTDGQMTGGVLPFAGGTGAGVSVCPLGFLIVSEGQVRMLPAQSETCIDRLVELAPTLLNDVKKLFAGEEKEEEQKTKPNGDPSAAAVQY